MDWSSCSADVLDSNRNVIGSAATLSCLPPLIAVVINWALIFAGIIAIFLVIYAGFKYMNSSGDPKEADTARKTLLYAIFGLFLVFMSFLIVTVISQIAGLNQNCYTYFGFTNCN